MNDLADMIKQNGGDIGLTRFPLLLLDHGVEAADGVILQAGHGAAAVQDKYDLGQILFHNKSSYHLACFYLHSHYRRFSM